MTRVKGTLHEGLYTFFISHSFLLRMINVTDCGCREYLNTHFMFNNVIFEKRADMS